MPLKKPGELFGNNKEDPKESSSVDSSFNEIKEEFNKVEDLRKQIDNVSSSLNNSLTEVVGKNLDFLSNEYSEKLDKFSNRINKFKEELDYKVDTIKKSNQDLKADIEVVEQRQNKINITTITEEVLSEVQDVLSGNLEENIKRLEGKIEIIKEAYEQNILNEGLLNEPPSTDNEDPLTPLDKNYATLDDLKQHYNTFLNRIQQQLSTLGGGGAVNIKDMDDVDSSAFVNGKVLEYDSTLKKWKGGTGGGGSGTKGQKGEEGTDKGQKGEVGPGGGDKGQKGEVGSTGSNGSAGAKGQKGEVGSTGSSGSTGNTGSKGQKGEVGSGSAGDKGQKGAEGSGGSGSFTRTTANAATSSIANNASGNITITAAKTYALQKIQTSAAAWVTLYTDTTSRSNDSSRNETTDPTPGSGVISEVITTGAATQLVTPGLIGFNNDGTPSTNVYLKVVNKSGSTQAITVTLHYLPLET